MEDKTIKSQDTFVVNDRIDWRTYVYGFIATIITLGLLIGTVYNIVSFYKNNPPYVRAVKCGDIDAVKKLIGNGLDVNGEYDNISFIGYPFVYTKHRSWDDNIFRNQIKIIELLRL